MSEIYFWFYSVLAQVFGAFLAVVGMFVVYRLQIQEERIREAFRKAEDFDPTFKKFSHRQIISQLESVKKSGATLKERVKDLMGRPLEDSTLAEKCEELLNQIRLQEKIREEIGKSAILPAILMGIIIGASLILLSFHKIIFDTEKMSKIGIIILISMLILSIYTLIKSITLMIKAIQIKYNI